MRRLICVACLAGAFACSSSSSSTGPVNVSVPGTWTLQTINGASLPATLVESSTSFSEAVSRATLTTTANTGAVIESGLFTEVITATILGMNDTFQETGTWVANGGSITFTNQTNSHVYQGSISGNTLTKIENGYTEVYSR